MNDSFLLFWDVHKPSLLGATGTLSAMTSLMWNFTLKVRTPLWEKLYLKDHLKMPV